jgi:hypothetical protein
MTETGRAVETYRGFTLDLSTIRAEPDFEARRTRLQRQIDIVADCGLPAKLLSQAQEIAFLISRNSDLAQSGSTASAENDEPILLRSVLHAMAGNPASPKLRQELQVFYGRALANKIYPRLGPMFTSPPVYFAVTATAFLLGVSHGLTRERVEAAQPQYFQWLNSLLRDPEEKRTLN